MWNLHIFVELLNCKTCKLQVRMSFSQIMFAGLFCLFVVVLVVVFILSIS